ncbi:hypothetical protein KIN20_028790 [Parelaphostrongylus tenuis]|uniref:Uncharacterized protein n=1 Tax=Parelaphostrongylus tenuis TaxID=148309 RepID=A0AAD5R1N2_PARTN|nr:hypothetical protein KIN20_028790 [Parelaphostrongylus tenuis]
MVYTSATNAVRFSGIATTEEGSKGFVQRLVMQTIINVLERQGRSALLPNAVISTILSQLTVDISYTPMNCPWLLARKRCTKNIIMANWSRRMWQSVVDRAVRMLASGPFKSHFLSARPTVGGN